MSPVPDLASPPITIITVPAESTTTGAVPAGTSTASSVATTTVIETTAPSTTSSTSPAFDVAPEPIGSAVAVLLVLALLWLFLRPRVRRRPPPPPGRTLTERVRELTERATEKSAPDDVVIDLRNEDANTK
ncbi:MAG: hypothetical protein ACFCVC_07005 [Acidimicrobiia bacterium]